MRRRTRWYFRSLAMERNLNVARLLVLLRILRIAERGCSLHGGNELETDCFFACDAVQRGGDLRELFTDRVQGRRDCGKTG